MLYWTPGSSGSRLCVVLDVSVYDPGMSDSPISAGRLMEAGYNVNVKIPDDALVDGFAPATSRLSPLRG